MALELACTSFSGVIPFSLGNLKQLNYLDLSENRFTGPIPASLANLTQLTCLSLSMNNFLGGPLSWIGKQAKLTFLDLGGINLSGSIPSSLGNLTQLTYLNLRSNKLCGQIPKCISNTSTQSLLFLDISQNFLSGFGQSTVVLPWVNLQVFTAIGNLLDGPLPIPPQSIVHYAINDNKLTGEISPSMCNLRNIQALILLGNKLSGAIPHCIGNLSDHLKLLSLQNNLFHGTLPQTYTNKCNLRVLDVSQNQLQGQLPRSLANCLMLKDLILSDNNFNDVFPFWLRTLPELRLLAMRYNGFLGVIRKPENNQVRFPKLRILDLSHNNFTGEFPAEDIFLKYAMRSNIIVNSSTYEKVFIISNFSGGLRGLTMTYDSWIMITSKGVDRYYLKVQEALAFIDISSNKFVGKIDEWIGNLNGLWSLNVSNNLLTGVIPSSLGNLMQLESLDLSNNKLSGEIPQQLAQLTFLSQFNVSHNNLTGFIPRERQFSTFDITSYEGNSELCGDPLPKKCGNSNTPTQPPPSSTEENDSVSGIEFCWKFVLAGFGSGLVVGVVLADVAITRRIELFLEIVEILIKLIERISSWKRFGPRN